ncbi:MAG: CinA family protein [Lachnospiraceae bacterium]|nr:CinA family protein [Lachnospiraceae bacterium]
MREVNIIAEKLVTGLIENNYTITTAESCTGGMISSTIVNIPGASCVLNESYVTYSNESKERILGVNRESLDLYGAVSEEVAKEMVEGVAGVAAADCAIAVTGIAGPDGGTPKKPVGTVYAGLYFRGQIIVKRYNFSGNRYEVRCNTVKNVLSDMLEIIKK